jgi:hypothetical protein
MFVLGMCSLLAGVITIFLPETLGNLLIEDINDIHNLKRDGKPFFSFWSEDTLNKHLEDLNKNKRVTQVVGIENLSNKV